MRNRGFTLIEMLVSLAITLIMMASVVALFGVVTESVSKSRALVETSDRLRAAREILQRDLDGRTADLTPPLSPENNQGYFEIIEGKLNDGSAVSNPATQLQGDVDDVLMFTTRNTAAPFLGKLNGTTVIESPDAEVIYFLVQNGPAIDVTTTPAIRLYTLYRRVLLVAPSQDPITSPANSFYTSNDLSVRYVDTPTPTMIPNTLGDLTKRENRFAHYSNAMLSTYGQFPFRTNTSILPEIPYVYPLSYPSLSGMTNWPAGRPQENAALHEFRDTTTRFGEDVLLTNVVAFDVQVYDPGVPVFVDASGVTIEPNAPYGVFATAASGTPVAFGGYTDLGWNIDKMSNTAIYTPAAGDPVPKFGDMPSTKSGWQTGHPATYDTWSLHFENNGEDEDGDGHADRGTNGLDDVPLNGLIDDPLEWETNPPYSTPIRGLKVRIRVYEPSSQQTREVEIISASQ